MYPQHLKHLNLAHLHQLAQNGFLPYDIVKIDFTHKARCVAGGHITDPPTSITY